MGGGGGTGGTGEDYAHHITACPPGFEVLKRHLCYAGAKNIPIEYVVCMYEYLVLILYGHLDTPILRSSQFSRPYTHRVLKAQIRGNVI